ncbi:hypothetical protein PPYR_02830 [Photinus pyralis]|uniref:FAM20 C-terminal domain-containing protein n=1 Tax=Photinus pyralis TaxID=7054 RepID=A0A5N4A135_PHOPY|nr:extracellular serine/threonine protein kinase four-jointed [Photinus pyralis]KAB0791030.1 hypothetical protein PPYR_02830 [Photinus pyralis]
MGHYNNLEEQTMRAICGGDFNGGGGARHKNVCLISVVVGFTIGLSLGIFLPLIYLESAIKNSTHPISDAAAIRSIFLNNSFKAQNSSPISFVELHDDSTLIEDGIYWGARVEGALPEGYVKHETWTEYVRGGVAVKLEGGCGRMQNRLLTFQDGRQGCVRYRQNTDQIQGELFSFYLAQILKLPNLAPSAVTTVNLNAPLWRNLESEIASAQWNSNRPVVITQFIPDLSSANIPNVFRPNERHLNKYDVFNMTGDRVLGNLVELAQWSDLIIFDYLTANLDRIVNNLYNYQWNVNIMDAPAHNLAKKLDLLVFLDNESGLLHGYRLLKKYEVYHSVLLDNLCVFRRSTADAIRHLLRAGNVGHLLKSMFEKRNSPQVKDVLPSLPEKSIKILNERIDKVHNQILRCESMFFDGNRT